MTMTQRRRWKKVSITGAVCRCCARGCHPHSSDQGPQPVQHPQPPACEDPVQDDRPRDREDLASDAEYLSLLFVFDRRRSDRVGKSGDGNKRPGAAPFRKTRIDAGAGEEDAQEDKEQGSPAAAVVRAQIFQLAVVIDDLPDETDGASEEKGFEHVEPYIVPWSFLPDIFFILFLLF